MVYLRLSLLSRFLILLLTWASIATALPAQTDSPDPSPAESAQSSVWTTSITLEQPDMTVRVPPVGFTPSLLGPQTWVFEYAYDANAGGTPVFITPSPTNPSSTSVSVNLKRANPAQPTVLTLTTVTLSEYGSTVVFPSLTISPMGTATDAASAPEHVHVIKFEHPSDFYGEAVIPHVYLPYSQKVAEPTGD